jgi:hypothetical protein
MVVRHDRSWLNTLPGRMAAAAIPLVISVVVSLMAAGAAAGAAKAPPANSGAVALGQRMAEFRAAAREFGVPARLLLAISYNQSRWERESGVPSLNGGFGLMDLTARTLPADEARGDPSRMARQGNTVVRAHYTLDDAARLLGVPVTTLETSERQNIRGAAAVLAHYARGLADGALPASLSDWYGAVAEYGGATSEQAAQRFADDVYATARTGESLRTSDGQFLELPATPGLQSNYAQLGKLRLAVTRSVPSTDVDCPAALECTFLPAAYAQDSSDPGDYGNYDRAGRPDSMLDPAGNPASMRISYIVIHDTEGSYDSAINTFQNPATYVSANYVVRSADGAVTEMVRPHDVSWGTGNWYVNMHAVNIENEGFAAQGGTWYTEAMYRSTAALVRYLAARYRIPLDRKHILGHEEVPGPTDYYTSVQHWDPGPFWNWDHFMALVHGISDSAERAAGGSVSRGFHQLLMIDPTFARNEPVVSDCPSTGCVRLPAQPANFVYLRSGPGSGYPLLGDPLLHASGAGTVVDSDWGDKAATGETFAYAGQSGNWTAIWFAGQKAWFYDPRGMPQAALYTGGAVITPKAGLTSIPVYGAAYPEASAYPPAVQAREITKLTYTIPAGQEYPLLTAPSSDYYYAATIESSLPDDHTVIIGSTSYYQISFSHRQFFVSADDVTIRQLP